MIYCLLCQYYQSYKFCFFAPLATMHEEHHSNCKTHTCMLLSTCRVANVVNEVYNNHPGPWVPPSELVVVDHESQVSYYNINKHCLLCIYTRLKKKIKNVKGCRDGMPKCIVFTLVCNCNVKDVGIGLCKFTFTIISSLPCLHTFWHAIPTSFYFFNVF